MTFDTTARIDDHRRMQITEQEVRTGLRRGRYVTTARVETAVFVALVLEKPLLIEGPAGAGKTEVAKVLAEMLSTDLVSLQCYEGLDEARALYEWNYQKQLLRLQADEHERLGWEQISGHIFSGAYLLEMLSDFQVSVPELGTIRAREIPVVVLTSNRARELSEALRRRCLHLFIDFPGLEQERRIIEVKIPELDAQLAADAARFVNALRK